jgi:branched-chain amino acid transport system permease protein
MVKRLLDAPVSAFIVSVGLILVTAYAVSHFPRSIVAFMLFQASILVLYFARMPAWLKGHARRRHPRRAHAAPWLDQRLLPRDRHPGRHLRGPRPRPQHRGRARRPARSRLRGLLRGGRLHLGVFGSPQANLFLRGEHFPLAQGWFFLFLLVGVGMAPGAGILLGLPVLRLHGDYLAIVTLGFGEVIRVLANNLDKPINFTNGPKGITPISRPPIFFDPCSAPSGSTSDPNVIYPLYLYFIVLAIVGVTVLVNRRLEDSHIGRAWEAIREDQTAAQAMGVPLVRSKLLAFACGASFAGTVGVLFSAKQVFINPESFTFMESIGVLAMVILGGMGSIPGAILGATVVTVLNLQVLKGLSLWLNELRNAGTTIFGWSLVNLPTQLEPAKYERMVFGLILVLMMIFRPQGILPARRRHRELTGGTGEPH